MKKHSTLKRYFSILLIALFCMTGCGDEENSSSPQSNTAKDASGTTAVVEEYNYEEFVNNTEVDLSELESEKISLEEAKEIVADYKVVQKEIKKYEKKFLKNNELTYDNLYDYLYDLKEHLESLYLEDVSYYSLYDDHLIVHYSYYSDANQYMYAPNIDGFDSGTTQTSMNIATYQPFYSHYGRSVKKFLGYPDDAANFISNEFAMYQFDNRDTVDDRNYNDEEVTFENILKFTQNNIVFWHGHGGDFEDDGCVISTSIEVTPENEAKYKMEVDEGRLVPGYGEDNVGHYCMTPSFFEKYVPDNALKNSIIYIGTCSSGANSTLIDVFINKGAMAVIANSGTIRTKYNLKMMRSFAEGLTLKNGNEYYTLDEALDYAKGKNGKTDFFNGSYPYITYGSGYQNVSLDWYEDYRTAERDVVLVLDQSGSMEGEPIQETKEAAVQFVDKVFEQDTRVSLVSYDSVATLHSPLSRNQEYLITSINDLYTTGSTNIYAGLDYADQLLEMSNAKKKIIVLMSDGLPNEGLGDTELIQYAEELKNKGYYVYTLGFFSQLDSSDLSSAQELMEGIASPGLHYEVDSAENLVYFFDDIANQISGTKYVHNRIACPVNVTVKSGDEVLSSDPDSENTRTSFGSLTYENVTESEEETTEEYEVYEEMTEEPEQAKILRLKMDKDYDIDIEGYDDGSMDYTVSYPNESGEYDDVREFPDIDISSSTNITSNTEKEEASYLKVDQDGDGKYETTYKTETNGEMEEVKDYTILYICIGAAVILIIVVIIIIVAINKNKKKKGPKEPQINGKIVGLFGGFMGQSHLMQVGIVCIIGRESACDIQLLHKKVSRRHCSIQLLPNGMYQVVDFSSNGTYYNNQELEKNKPYTLPKGSLLVIGNPDNVIQLQ